MLLFYAVFSFLLVLVVTIGTANVVMRWDPIAKRLGVPDAEGRRAATDFSILRWEEKDSRDLPQWRRTLEKLGRALLGSDPSTKEARQSATRRRLTWAGFSNPNSVLVFLGSKAVIAFAFGYSYILYGLAVRKVLPQVLLVSLILGCIGFFLPDIWLRFQIKKRQRSITNTLPDVLDLLVVCVEAGLALDAAIARVSDPEMGHVTPLHSELRRLHLESRAGRPMGEALRALGERTGEEGVRRVVAAFIQTEKLGTSLADTLRVHAESSRIQRRHRAEKAAQLAPLKMLFPIVLFLFPAIFVVTLVPAMLKILELFGGHSIR